MKNHNIKAIACLLLICFLFAGCIPPKEPAREGKPMVLGRGVNIGNALEAPKGESWGVEMKDEYFDMIKEAGFDTVRMPVRFSDYLDPADNRIDEGFLIKIDGYINHGLDLGLNVILDLHHFTEMMAAPEAERTNLTVIWRQLSERYKDYPRELVFEILNEPKDKLSYELWNQYLREVVGIIRETNPDRLIVVGGVSFNSAEGLEALSLPKDGNIVVTFHYYVPTEFTFQGNPYHEGYEALRDIRWTGGDKETARIRDDFEKVRDWAGRNNVKVLLGEFGAVKTIPFEYRGKWTLTVVTIAEEMGFSWCYWELCSWFGILEADTMQWDQDMLQILLQK